MALLHSAFRPDTDIDPLNVRKMRLSRLLTKCFAPICWIANYSEDNVNHPSNNQGQVF